METNTVMVTLFDAEAEYPPLGTFTAEVRSEGGDTLTLVASTDGLDAARALLFRLRESADYPSAHVRLRSGEREWVARVVPDGPNRLDPNGTRDGQERFTVEFAVRVSEMKEA